MMADTTGLTCLHLHSVTAYALQDDALSTGELDYINGGTRILMDKARACMVPTSEPISCVLFTTESMDVQ
jgi:hypothetical protein